MATKILKVATVVLEQVLLQLGFGAEMGLCGWRLQCHKFFVGGCNSKMFCAFDLVPRLTLLLVSSKVWVFRPRFLYFLMTSWRDMSRAKSNWPMRGQHLSHCPIGSPDFPRDRSREGHVIMYSRSRDVNFFHWQHCAKPRMRGLRVTTR